MDSIAHLNVFCNNILAKASEKPRLTTASKEAWLAAGSIRSIIPTMASLTPNATTATGQGVICPPTIRSRNGTGRQSAGDTPPGHSARITLQAQPCCSAPTRANHCWTCSDSSRRKGSGSRRDRWVGGRWCRTKRAKPPGKPSAVKFTSVTQSTPSLLLIVISSIRRKSCNH